MPKNQKTEPGAAPAPEKPGTRLDGCQIEVNSAANEHTREAVVALAAAAAANAKAIEAIAAALGGPTQVTGIRIG